MLILGAIKESFQEGNIDLCIQNLVLKEQSICSSGWTFIWAGIASNLLCFGKGLSDPLQQAQVEVFRFFLYSSLFFDDFSLIESFNVLEFSWGRPEASILAHQLSFMALRLLASSESVPDD